MRTRPLFVIKGFDTFDHRGRVRRLQLVLSGFTG